MIESINININSHGFDFPFEPLILKIPGTSLYAHVRARPPAPARLVHNPGGQARFPLNRWTMAIWLVDKT